MDLSIVGLSGGKAAGRSGGRQEDGRGSQLLPRCGGQSHLFERWDWAKE